MEQIKKKSIIDINELLLTIYLLLFPTIGCFYKSSFMNNIGTILILLVSLLYNLRKIKIDKYFIIINSFVILMFLFSLINYNDMYIERFKDYILYGIVTTYLSTYVVDYKKVISYMSLIMLIVYFLSFNEPFNNYAIFGGYMSYGLFCVLPSFLCFHISRKFLNKKFFLPFEILSIFSLLFSNRNTILICAISVVLLDIYISKNDIKKRIKYLLVIFIGCIVLYYLPNIFNFLISKYGINSYALRTIQHVLEGGSNILSGRDNLWIFALEEIKENPILGIGIGGYEAKYGIYCHNLLLDLYLSFGIFGLFFIVFIFKRIINIYKAEKHSIEFWFIILIGILPLLFNNTYMTWKYFWLMLIYIFCYRRGVKNE